MRDRGNRFLRARTRWLVEKGGGGSSAPSTVTQTTTSEPPAYVKEPAKRFLSRAEDLSNLPYSTYQGERIAPLNPTHQTALQQGQFAQQNMLPGAAATMNNFAMGNYNSPAYIHPYVGPMLPNYTMPGYGGLSPMPHIGYAGKGGAMPGAQGAQGAQMPGGQGGQMPELSAPMPVPLPNATENPYLTPIIDQAPAAPPPPSQAPAAPPPAGPTGDTYGLVQAPWSNYNTGLMQEMMVPQWYYDMEVARGKEFQRRADHGGDAN